jgi:hypothetical protein
MLTTLPPSVSRLSTENVGTSTSHNPMGLHGMLQGQLSFLCVPIQTSLLNTVEERTNYSKTSTYEYTEQHKHRNISMHPCPSGIRTHDPIVWQVEPSMPFRSRSTFKVIFPFRNEQNVFHQRQLRTFVWQQPNACFDVLHTYTSKRGFEAMACI